MVSKIGICQLIANICFASDYYLTYHFITNNSIANGDRVYFSKAMTPFNGSKIHSFTIQTNEETEKEFISNNQEQIIDNIIQYHANIKSNTIYTEQEIFSDTAKLYLSPTRIRIELNGGFAIISILK